MRALDLEAVQAFVLIADLRSFTRAADILDTTQSAISLKLKRLEERLGHKLIERTPRMVRLSAKGVLRHDDSRRDGDVLLNESFGWMAAPHWKHRAGEPLRLATQAYPCRVRAMAVTALEAARMPWREVFVGGGIATIGAAVQAGLAVAAMPQRVAPPGTIDVGARFGFPPLPSRDVVLYSSTTDRHVRSALRTLSHAFKSTPG